MSAPTILIVDDVATNAAVLRGVLTSEGFRTIEAADGVTARKMIRQANPDLILLDVQMPGESGFETCAHLKSDPATADIPIIFLSALDDVKSKVTGLKAGGVDYISKPVHREEVLARVRVHLRISETNRLLAREHHDRLMQLRDAQQAILTRPEDCPEAAFAVYYEPLEGAGGDFYDVVALDSDTFGYFVADVSGHGISAAFLTSAVKALLRQYAGPLYAPEDTMRGVGSVMHQLMGEEQYLTASYARLNRRTMRLAVVSAGHPPAVLVNAAGQATTIEMDGDPLGVFSSVVLQRKELKVALGDRLFLYSDGMIEARAGGGRCEGIEKLIEACLRHHGASLPEATAAIARDLRPEAADIEDDLLLLGFEVRE